jgi:antitoxin-like ribbon-helix-helix protein
MEASQRWSCIWGSSEPLCATPEIAQTIKLIAAEQDKDVQEILAEASNMLLPATARLPGRRSSQVGENGRRPFDTT